MKKTILKTAAAIIAAISCLAAFNTTAFAAKYKEYTAPEKFVQLYETNVNINFLGSNRGIVKCYFYNNRLCVPIRQSVEALGGTLDTDESHTNFVITINGETRTFPITPSDNNRVTTLYMDNVGYIYMYDLLNAFGFKPTFNVDGNSITIYKNGNSMTPELLTKPGVDRKPAYIRLEDITANGLDYSDPKYSDKRLEKLMAMAEYLYLREQEYYIAWIPYYANPGYEVWNDLTDTTNLYNSCFMYTLDYMVDHGGHLGVHGYSHQFGIYKSADGYEWGKDTPYSIEEQQDRMILARQTAERLGFKAEFFEFPHYGATKEQLEMAEQYFDVIYQSHPDNTYLNHIAPNVNESGKKTYYIPTPADYVHSVMDLNNALARLKTSANNGWEESIFYHPILDLDKITFTTSDDYTRSWFMPSSSILTQIINQIMNDGYSFTHFDPANYQN